MQEQNANIVLHYPYNNEYEYTTTLERIDLDKQRDEDIKTGRGFMITAPRGIKKDIKNQDGIYSSKFGSNSMSDIDSFSGRYRCTCGQKRGSINNGELCTVCGTRVKYVDDDITLCGYLSIHEPYVIIHPNLYCSLEAFIGATRLNKIINPDFDVDSDGNMKPIPVKKDEPFANIGMLEFRNRFDDIMNFYLTKYPQKIKYYTDIMKNKDILFTHTISVYSSLLRPCSIDNGSLRYEDCNDQFSILSSLCYRLNDDKLSIDKKPKERLKYMYDIQYHLTDLYRKIKDILAKKKGDIRCAIGGRYDFSGRCVIAQDPDLRADLVKLPFASLLELLQQVIINILVKSYGYSYSDAYKKWNRAQITNNDSIIRQVIQHLIDSNDGLPVIINRNPTIQYGSILACRVVGINDNFTMSISLLVLPSMAADFDGDTLNILYMYNKDFIELAEKTLSPKYMFISRDDGMCNKDLIHGRDNIINANSLKSLYPYTNEQKEKIRRLQTEKTNL